MDSNRYKHFLLVIKDIIEQTSQDKVYFLRAYRYGSWLITSIFYLLVLPHSPIIFKLGVIVCLFIAIKPILRLYENPTYSQSYLIRLTIIETIGIALLLLPTGGLKSPFIWYAINPVLVTASYLSYYICWLNLTLYLVLSVFISAFRKGIGIENLFNTIMSNSQTLLVFILITIAFQLHARLAEYFKNQTEILQKQKQELMEANRVTQEYIEHVTALYQFVEAFCSHDDRQELMKIFASYTSILSGGCHTIVGLREDCSRKMSFQASENTDKITEKKMKNILVSDFKDSSTAIQIRCLNENKQVICVPINSADRYYGVIGVLVSDSKYHEENVALDKKLIFLAKLSGIVLERIRLEEIADNILLTEEQDRIANEIHDTVSQRLFGISFSLHSLSSNCLKMPSEMIKEQVKFIQKTANEAAKELKSSIYRLSARKSGKQVLAKTINTCLNEIARLNNVEVIFETKGSEEHLNSDVQMAFYRVVREATGNAVKHGKCSRLDVNLYISPSLANLSINDNGGGFEYKAACRRKSGLGLRNMDKLIKALNGNIKINSRKGMGTSVICEVPLIHMTTNDLRGDIVEGSNS